MLWITVLLASREIRRNVLRSVLTILGVVIGVAAVIIMVAIGGGGHRGSQAADCKYGQQSSHGQPRQKTWSGTIHRKYSI
jgi:hypothetical protein